MTKVAYYRSMVRQFAALAARNRWMRKDRSHTQWAERARAALMMMEIEIAEAARQ